MAEPPSPPVPSPRPPSRVHFSPPDRELAPASPPSPSPPPALYRPRPRPDSHLRGDTDGRTGGIRAIRAMSPRSAKTAIGARYAQAGRTRRTDGPVSADEHHRLPTPVPPYEPPRLPYTESGFFLDRDHYRNVRRADRYGYSSSDHTNNEKGDTAHDEEESDPDEFHYGSQLGDADDTGRPHGERRDIRSAPLFPHFFAAPPIGMLGGLTKPPGHRRISLEMESGRVGLLAPSAPAGPSNSQAKPVRRGSKRKPEKLTFRPGIFSQLLSLSLAGPSSAVVEGVSGTKPESPFAATSGHDVRSAASAVPGGVISMKSLGIKRADRIRFDEGDEGELDNEDPRVTGVLARRKARRAAETRREDMMAQTGGGLGMFMTLDSAGQGGDEEDSEEARMKAIQAHLTETIIRQSFILKLAKALMTFGAPSHRIESQLSSAAIALELDAQFIHFPGLVVASFGDPDTRTSETHFLKSGGGDLDLGKLHEIHAIYRGVVHDEITAAEGTKGLHRVLRSEREYTVWHRMAMAFVTCGLIAPMCYGGSLIDGLAAGALATMAGYLQLHLTEGNAIYSSIFEVSMATVISFVARGLSVTGFFCYGAVASAGVSLVLPGYTILCASLELASTNIVAGSVRMVYAIIFSLFLGFGITIGSDFFYIIDPPARRAVEALLELTTSSTTLTGTFASSSAPSWNGTFTFLNSTLPPDPPPSLTQLTSLACNPLPDWAWYRQPMPSVFLAAFVPITAILSALWSFQPLRSRELPVMTAIGTAGFFASLGVAGYLFERDDVVAAVGTFVIGVLGNLYARFFGGSAFTAMAPGIMLLVPGSIGAVGGLATSPISGTDRDPFAENLVVGFRMMQVAIGMTVGMFGSGFLMYTFKGKKNAALFSF